MLLKAEHCLHQCPIAASDFSSVEQISTLETPCSRKSKNRYSVSLATWALERSSHLASWKFPSLAQVGSAVRSAAVAWQQLTDSNCSMHVSRISLASVTHA